MIAIFVGHKDIMEPYNSKNKYLNETRRMKLNILIGDNTLCMILSKETEQGIRVQRPTPALIQNNHF